jgi:hypothetical protein
MVESPYEERIYGARANRKWTVAFRAVILVAVVGSVVVAAIATPVYRRDYFLSHGDIRLTWCAGGYLTERALMLYRFNLTEVALGMFFVIEFLIKVVADGFIFAPNAYLLSIWNILDFFVLLTLLVNVTTSLVGGVGVNRFTRALNAFRALRLINMSARVRETFYTVFCHVNNCINKSSIWLSRSQARSPFSCSACSSLLRCCSCWMSDSK